MKRELLYFTFFLLICFTLPLTATAQVVNILDSNLRAAIETALGKTSDDTITVADMARLTHLEARNTNISDLTGLEHATNLTGLWLERNAFTDISPLAGLTNLTELNLGGNNLSNISPVAGLTNLRQLWLWDNNISDISPLAGLTNLIELILQSNAISDISPVAGLTNLTGLWLADNTISDISPLVANTGLGSGDRVFVNDNPLSFVSIKTHIPALQSRGVTVEFDDTTHLNVGDPRTVRLIYFLPNDRPYRADVVQRLKDEIRSIQTFYAEQMGAHGHGNKTFHVETDHQGEPMVHHVDGQYPNSHYYTEGIARTEIAQAFNLNANLYFIVIDTDVLRRNDTGQPIGGAGAPHGKIGGYALFHSEFGFGLAVHELGHAFGLWHDFRDGAYIMSYGPGQNQLSACHAEYLAIHPYFNPDTSIEEVSLPIIELISPRIYPVGSKSIPVQLKVSDSAGLHQGLLIVKTIEPHGAAGSLELKMCRGLSGKKEAIIQFDYDGVIPSDSSTSLSNPITHPISVEVVDMDGNVAQTNFVLFSEVLQPLTKISGDNQTGLPNTPLLQPFVIEVQDENGSKLAGVSVVFAVTAGGGTLSVTRTTTDENGRAESTLTLGPNLGTNIVEVSASGIESTATFYAIADTELPPITADVNSDSFVNVLDLIFIASSLGQSGQNEADVNGDGVVNILDLILVAGRFEDTAAAPSAQPQAPEILTAVEVQGWLTDARALEVRDSIVKRGFVVLEQLLVSLTPRETELLANYPNPFNPETWIPYRLAEDAFVTLIIYDGSGHAVRKLEVGHRIASAYENRSKAIYWDGRNGLGEPVTSGVYFYTLTAGDHSATRRMVILK